jgi:hypothetical protein
MDKPTFRNKAMPLVVAVNHEVGPAHLTVTPKEWASGRVGWTGCKEVYVYVNGVPIACRVSVRVECVTSKAWKDDP